MAERRRSKAVFRANLPFRVQPARLDADKLEAVIRMLEPANAETTESIRRGLIAIARDYHHSRKLEAAQAARPDARMCLFEIAKGARELTSSIDGLQRACAGDLDRELIGFGGERAKLKLHPTCKNQTMIADAILDCTDRNDLVLDAFLGSGTTVLAAHETGRIGVGVELDGHYVDLAVARIAEATGEQPVHLDGRTFDEVRAERAADEANPING